MTAAERKPATRAAAADVDKAVGLFALLLPSMLLRAYATWQVWAWFSM